jgi:hypothetical protein
MSYFLDIADLNLKKYGESLCGDKVKVVTMSDKTVIVLSDGLGSGVKANILATLTTEIIVKMLCADVDMEEVVKTVINTLPVCQVRKIAYSTFVVMEIQHSDYSYKIMNFDSPAAMIFRNETKIEHNNHIVPILNRDISMFTGNLKTGDYVVLVSDGVLHAGLGVKMNFGWGRENIADFIAEKITGSQPKAWNVAHQVLSKTYSLYGGKCGDDASVVVVNVRPKARLTIFTGPPLDMDAQPAIVEKFLSTKGRKIVCGGTTANIVADYLKTNVDVDIKTMTETVPPIGKLKNVDLVTEGIITMSECLRLLQDCGGDISKLPTEKNGAVLLAMELLSTEMIDFIVGQCINEFYQNPCLPKNISVRKHLVKDFASLLIEYGKEVTVKYY